MQKRTTTLLLCAAIAAGCAGPKPLATDAEISAAEANNTLPALYNQVKGTLVGKDRNTKKFASQFALLDNIGRRLAARMDYDLRKKVEAARIPENKLVPLNVLTEVQASMDPMRTWEPSRHDVLSRDLDKDATAVRKAIADVQAYLSNLAPENYRKHMDALGQLARLTGDSRYSEQRDAMLRSVRSEYEQARQTDDFQKALVLLDELPPEGDVAKTRVELQTRLFERKFNDLLAEDKPDEAFKLFETLASSSSFDEVRGRVAPTGKQLADYFIALASNATTAGNLPDAYRWFRQSRSVRARIDGRADSVPEEKLFVDSIYRGHDKARDEKLWGVAYGYLQIVQEFDPLRPTLARDLRVAEEEVNNQSIRSGSVQPFSSAVGDTDYSRAIATRITEYIFQTIPEDVRIISYDNKSVPIDYLINGDVTEARVESSEQNVKKTERVVTEKDVLVRNPKYDEWMKLSDREKKAVPAPPAQIPTDKQEVISYNTTQMRKAAYFSTAYRIIEAATGKVLFTDSLTLKRELTSEGNEGVSIGTFSIPSKSASLPTNIEILNQLSNEAAQEIGKRLTDRIGNLEKRYADAAKQAATSGNMIDSTLNFSFAVVTAQRKKLDASAYIASLRDAVVTTGYAH